MPSKCQSGCNLHWILLAILGHQKPDVAAMDREGNDAPFTAWAAANEVVNLKLATAVEPPTLQGVVLQLLEVEGLVEPIVLIAVRSKTIMRIASHFGFSGSPSSAMAFAA